MYKYLLATQVAIIATFSTVLPMDSSIVPTSHRQKTFEHPHISNKPVSQLLRELSLCNEQENYYPAINILQDLTGRIECKLLSSSDNRRLARADFTDVFKKLPEYHLEIGVVRKHSQYPHLPEHSMLREIQGTLALCNTSVIGHDLYPELSDEDISLAIEKNKRYYLEAQIVYERECFPGNPENNFRLQMVNNYAAEITLMQGELCLRRNRDQIDAQLRAQAYGTPTDKSKKSPKKASFNLVADALPILPQPEIAPIIQKKDEKLVFANLSDSEKQALALELEKYSLFMQTKDEKLVLPVLLESEILPATQLSTDEKPTQQSKIASVIQQSNAMLAKIKNILADDKETDRKPASAKFTNNKKPAAPAPSSIKLAPTAPATANNKTDPAKSSTIQPTNTAKPVVRQTKKSQLALDAKKKNS